MGNFPVRYDSRLINYNHRGFIRLATEGSLQWWKDLLDETVWTKRGIRSKANEKVLKKIVVKVKHDGSRSSSSTIGTTWWSPQTSRCLKTQDHWKCPKHWNQIDNSANCIQTLQVLSAFYAQQILDVGNRGFQDSGYGSVGTAVACDTWGLQFESSH